MGKRTERIDIMGDGLWWLDPKTLQIHPTPDKLYYRVDLPRLTDSAEVLDTILHEDTKYERGPANDAKILSLMRGLNLILRPMDGMCSFGNNYTLTEAEVRRRVAQFVESRRA